jgi:hypothetical protein
MKTKRHLWALAWKTRGPDLARWYEGELPLEWIVVDEDQPIVWRTKLRSNRRLYVPAEYFEPGEIIHVSLVF